MKSLLLFALLSANIFTASGVTSRVDVLVTLTSGDLIRVHQVSPSRIVPRTLVYRGEETRLREDVQGGWIAGTLMGPGEEFRIKFSDGKTRAFSGVREYDRPGWVSGE